MHIKTLRLLPEQYPSKDVYPFNLDIFSKQKVINFTKNITFFTGENGTGKSTLLKAIAKRCNIHIWKGEERARYNYNRYEEDMYRYIQVDWCNGMVPGAFFASENFRNFAQLLDEWASMDPGVLKYFGDKSLMTQSHGQYHMAYFKNRFNIRGIYFLDEPENAFSPLRQIEFLKILKDSVASGQTQFIIASHSPIILAYPDATLYSFNNQQVTEINYEETDYYAIYKDFLENRKKYLEELFCGQ